MDKRQYYFKQLDKRRQLYEKEPTNDIEKAILHLELIICDIQPYGRWWRWGYIKSLRLAIKALKKNVNNLDVLEEDKDIKEVTMNSCRLYIDADEDDEEDYDGNVIEDHIDGEDEDEEDGDDDEYEEDWS